jgi:hypothetical protein
MLTKQDLKSIGVLLKVQKEELVDEVVDKVVDKVDKRLDEKFETHTKEIIKSIADYIHDALIPLFDDHESRISKLERHAGHPPISV